MIKFLDRRISTSAGIIVIVLVAVVLAGGVLTWQDRVLTAIPTPTPTPVVKELTIDDIKNATYDIATTGWTWPRVPEDHKFVQFNNGKAEYNGTEITIEKVFFGDLNSDGKKDGAAVLRFYSGGTSVWRYLAVLINQEGNPVHAASVGLGEDRDQVNSVNISNSVITVDMTVHGPQEAFCCPTVPKAVKYMLSGNQLIEIQEESIRDFVDRFYAAIEEQDTGVMSYFTSPITSEEKQSYNWLIAADLGNWPSNNRIFLRTKISSHVIKEVEELNGGSFRVNVSDKIQGWSNADPVGWSEPQTRNVSLILVRTNGWTRWSVDMYVFVGRSFEGNTPGNKYSGFGQ